MKLRIKFRKYGAVRYIGHLDVMRFFQKAIRRAGIDVKYSNGFSPHQIMTFAAPLGVGIVSNGEYMDIEVHSLACHSAEMPSGDDKSVFSPEDASSKNIESSENMAACCLDIRNRLNAASVPGIEVVSVTILPDTAGNAMASVAAAAYTVRFREGRVPRTDIAAALPGFLAKERIPVTKKTKKGVREIDLKEGIFRLTCSLEPLPESGASASPGKSGAPMLTMLLDASSGGNIKPVQVVEALLAQAGEAPAENALSITREDVYTNGGTKENPVWIPLDEIGSCHCSLKGEGLS